jgi:GTP-binding protein YchF
MGFNCGIVGMPNVGKSTLFNALTATAAAEAANYPFCTIEPNVGRVAVPDLRLDTIAGLAKSARIVPTQLEFVDIAGLVRGANQGEGLGNKFLSHIRDVDAIVNVLRCFEDDGVTHVEGSVDPVRDAEIIATELLIADLESLERRVDATTKRAAGGERDAKDNLRIMKPILAALQEGKPARSVSIDAADQKRLDMLQLLTAKPVLYVCNVEEESAATGNSLSARVASFASKQGSEAVIISAKIEAEIAMLADAEERADFLETLGLMETGLDRIIKSGYRLLDLITFLTAGPKEARAWTVCQGAAAVDAAGTIHTDFVRGFICAETIGYDDYVTCCGELGAKEAGKMRQEGRDYKVRDGDIMLFRFNV